MKTRIFLLVATLWCIFFTSNINAQVTSVNYRLKYDTVMCRYDAYVIINAGSATSIAQRTQFNAQYSIVVPAGDTLIVVQSYNPLYNNQTYTSTSPLTWKHSSTVQAPAAQPANDFYSITPILSPTAQYANISSGDTIKLFSFTVENYTNCGSGIRLFENGSDPNSSAAGMGGSDFNNGFTMGGTAQLYNANSVQLYPPKPLLVDPLEVACANGIEIDLTASTTGCQTPLTFAWTGPNSYSSTTEDVNITPASTLTVGTYKVVVTDALGCKDSLDVYASNKPDAGADQTVCAGTSTVISGLSPTTGTWTAGGSNPSGATMGPLPGGQANITFSNSASGVFTFIYSTPTCSDEMTITVNAKPTVSITGSNSICIGATTQLSPTSGGTWVSSNTAIATVTNGGLVTAVATGSATFTFTSTATGCFSITNPVTINPPPTTAITGSPAVCIGGTTTVTPATGGTWVSSNTAVATVTNAGLVTGITAGTVTLTFTETSTGCVGGTLIIEVKAKPTVSITGASSICITSTTQLSPTTGGTWASSNALIATVSNSGLVTGVAAGSATFVFTETLTGCQSNATSPVTVVARPVVSITGPTTTCVGIPTAVSPTSGGTWVSNNTAVANIDNAGNVTPVGQGSVTFTFTSSTAPGCSNTTNPVTVNPPPTVSAASTTICIGSTTTLSPATGGTWSALDPSIATRSGVTVTGVSAGSARFRFTETSSGCQAIVTITVTPRPVVSITGPTEICAGYTSQLSPSTGGTWASSNASIATVSNSGLVTGVAVGTATFIFTSSTTLCPSLPTAPITVKNQPVVSITGSDLICIGQTTTLSTTGGAGTWTSSNTAVATVTSGGLVTAVGAGFVSFTFTETASGCVSAPTGNVTVNIAPIVAFTGPSAICIGATTNLSPTTGGTWTSSNASIATVTNAGLVTGIAAGSVNFTFQQTSTGCISTALTGTVNPKIAVAITGDTMICIGNTTTLSPTSGGSWSSSNTSIATITNAGVVTGVAQGTAIFYFISTAGCQSDPITSIAVMPVPTVSIPTSNICIASTAQLSPSTGGTWVSLNTAVATISSSGLVTGVAAGSTQFRFTTTAGCPSALTSPITVNPTPVTVINGASTICVGKTTTISPTTGGTWSSSNTAVATISNTGLITGTGVGSVTFVFTNTTTGCVSASSSPVTVTAGPTVSINDYELCIGETATASPTPNTSGTWTSSNSSIATITNTGLITAVAGGTVTFTFTDAGGCKSLPTSALTVHPRPTVSIAGSNAICIGATTTLSPSTGGTWASSNTAIATVTNAGVVTGVAIGSATFIFTSSTTGCSSLATLPVTVKAAPIVSITGPTEICVGATTTLSPTTGGVWSSTNTSAAIVNNFGVVTAVGPGTATFIFTETATGCASAAATGAITVTHCFNPDFNATRVNVSVPGDVSTNDFVISGTTYGPSSAVVTVSQPAGSFPVLTINPDGTYTFITNKIGVYKFEVPVCVPPATAGCPRSDLTINVVDFIDPDKKPIANVDIATTALNTPVVLRTMENDRCAVVTGCSLDPASVVISVNPKHGSFSFNSSTGDNTYTPNTGFVGLDTLTYKVCVTGESTNCSFAKQIITVNAPTAVNTTVAADDFAVTQQETPVSGNVKTNDVDPQGEAQTVTGYTTTVAAGTLVLNNDGTYTFTPAVDFSGPVEFVYTTTDNNSTPATADATLHILVLKDLEIKVRVYLEGALMDNGNATASDGRPLMRDNLRVNPFTGANYIPSKDPFKFPVKLQIGANLETTMDVSSLFTHKTPGTLSTKFDSIPSPSTVFAVSGQEAIVDWILIELRSKTTNTFVVKTRTGLLQRDGDVVDMNGTNGLRFPGLAIDDYYVTVRHHRHLGVMTAAPQTPTQLSTLVNFTVPTTATFDFGQHTNGQDYTGLAQKTGLKPGYLAMWGGNFDYGIKLKFENPNDDLNFLFGEVLGYPSNPNGNVNYDFAYGYLYGDFNMNGKSKFDNPNDDKNMLYGQLLFYPLNSQFLSNFDFFIEQLP